MGDVTDSGLGTFLVEHYWPGVSPAEFEAAAERVRAAAEELEREGRLVRYLHSTLVPEDESAFCVFEAGSQAEVGEAYSRAGVAFERLLPALEMPSASAPPRRDTGSDLRGEQR